MSRLILIFLSMMIGPEAPGRLPETPPLQPFGASHQFGTSWPEPPPTPRVYEDLPGTPTPLPDHVPTISPNLDPPALTVAPAAEKGVDKGELGRWGDALKATTTATEARLRHYDWCRKKGLYIAGWNHVIESWERTGDGVVIRVTTRPRVREVKWEGCATNDFVTETYLIEATGRVLFIGLRPGEKSWGGSYFIF